jgi:hypothetical protein
MITDAAEYIAGLESEIERIKAKGKHFLYRPADELSKDVSQQVEIYFMKRNWYILEMKKCMSCLSTYEIIIEIRSEFV